VTKQVTNLFYTSHWYVLGIQVGLSPTLSKNEKVEHYIRIKTLKH